MKRRLVAVLAGLLVVITACSSSGAPESFTEQPGALPDSIVAFAGELLQGDGAPPAGAVPLVQRNFLEGCMVDNTLKLDDLSGAPLASACGCSYNSLVTFLIDNAVADQTPFDTFKDLNDRLKDDGEVLDSQYRDLFEECRA